MAVTVTRKASGTRAPIADFLALHGLPPDSVNSLTEVSRLRWVNRGRLVLPVSSSAFFLVDGRVSESVRPGNVRLWRELMLFERLSSATSLPGTDSEETVASAPASPVFGSALSRCIFVEIANTQLNALMTSDPAIALMLARMATKRHQLTERLYSASRATPTARVAAVLNYLAEPTRRKAIKPRNDGTGTLVMTVVDELVASGPSQTDLADALCLGRATVEKAIAELRQLKALRSFSPGERANRCYPIKDRHLLRQIALGG